MFDSDAWLTVIETLKPLYKCHKNSIEKEAIKTIDRLQQLKLENSSNTGIQKYADRFILDSLLAAKQYTEYIKFSKELEQGIPQRFHAYKRLELSFRENILIDPNDVLALPIFNKSQLISENFSLFKEHFNLVFRAKFPRNEDALSFLYRRKKARYLPFFAGLVFYDEPRLINKRINIFLLQQRCFWEEKEALADIKILIREAENKLRESFRLPHVGKGWVQETRLFNLIYEAFPETKVTQHGSPSWLGRQHLDIWIPEHKIAIEYHGKQHYEPVEFFGGEEGFKKTIERDKKKIALCKDNNVNLIILNEKSDFNLFLYKIKGLIN